MRTSSTVVSTLISSGSIKYFILVELAGLKYTTYAADITMKNGAASYGPFLADNGLQGIDPPRMSSVVDREAYKVTLTDPAFALRTTMSAAIGKKLAVYFGFINSLSVSVTGSDGVAVAPGFPLLDMRDTISSYGGIVNGSEYAIEPSEGTAVLTVTGSSPLVDLDAIRSVVTSQAYAQGRRAGDTSYDEAHAASKSIVMNWGKK